MSRHIQIITAYSNHNDLCHALRLLLHVYCQITDFNMQTRFLQSKKWFAYIKTYIKPHISRRHRLLRFKPAEERNKLSNFREYSSIQSKQGEFVHVFFNGNGSLE